MAGIGVRLNKLFEKRSIVTALAGMGYSTAGKIFFFYTSDADDEKGSLDILGGPFDFK